MEQHRKTCQNIFGTFLEKKDAQRIEKNIFKQIQLLQADEDTYKWVIYQYIGFILSNPSQYKAYLGEIKTGKIGWKSATYDNAKKSLEERDSYTENPFEVSEGVVECSKCGSTKTFSFQKQLRSGDEGMTTFFKCMEPGCRTKGRYN